MQNTPSHETPRVPANDRNVLAWTAEGFKVSAEAIAEMANETKDEKTMLELVMLALALSEASEKVAAYLGGASGSFPSVQ